MVIHIFSENKYKLPVYFSTLDCNYNQETVKRPNGTHDLEHLMFVLGGKGELKIDHKSFELKRKCAYFLGKRIAHEYINKKDLKVAYITFMGSAAGELHKHFTDKNYVFYENIDVESYVESIKEIENEYFGSKSESKMSAMVYSIIMRFFREGEVRTLPIMEHVSQYIEQNFQDKITLSDLTKLTNLSKTKFCIDFKNYFGCTAFQKIIDVRLSYANQLVRNSGLMTKEIAYLCGFDDISYFCSCYKKKYSKTPKETRIT